MLTSRAWWLLITAFGLLCMGLFGKAVPVMLVGLTLLLWLCWEGIRFTFHARWVLRNLTLHREIYDDRGQVQTLWAGRVFEVHTTLKVEGVFSLPYVRAREMMPFGVNHVAGSAQEDGVLSPLDDIELRYRIRPLAAGKIRFEGVSVHIADLQGLFQSKVFVREAREILVLPELVNLDTHTSLKKQRNTLMPPGIHQLAAPGSGSELLDLRDYIPGDPPKTIAWKVSARRDRLITKEYESEVPVRCTLFIDTSSSVRVGPPGSTPLTRLVEIAASTTQANMGSRDLTGLCLFDEHGTKVIRPARNRRHLIQVLHTLAESSSQLPEAESADFNSLLSLGYTFAQEVYPERMKSSVNRMPVWLAFFAPTPNHWTNDAGWISWAVRWFFTILVSIPYLLIFGYLFVMLGQHYNDIPQNVADFISEEMFREDPLRIVPEGNRPGEPLPPYEITALAFLLVIFLLLPLWLKFFLVAVPMLFRPKLRRNMRYRKRLAGLLTQHYQLGPGGIEMLFQEEKQLMKYLVRFLHEHRVPFLPTLHDAQGRYLFAQPEKLQVLKKALANSIGKGRDNELFVLFVDVLELEEQLEPLIQAIKIALARHHQVMVVLPWPPDFPVPEGEHDKPVDFGLRGKDRPMRWTDDRLLESLERLEHQRYLSAYQHVRAVLARLRVPVVCAADVHSVRLILERMDRLRRQQRHPALR